METEIELLVLAAKAAGFTLEWGRKFMVGDCEVDCTDMAYICSGEPDVSPAHWNPLVDDGDALRLAIKLRISLIHHDELETIEAVTPVTADGSCTRESQPLIWYGSDPMANARRAIVRAAASIGERGL